jgi:hypothetical protein
MGREMCRIELERGTGYMFCKSNNPQPPLVYITEHRTQVQGSQSGVYYPSQVASDLEGEPKTVAY